MSKNGEAVRRFVRKIFASIFARFIARAFFTTLLWVFVSFLVSEFMPAMGLSLVGSDGKPTGIKFIDFADRKLWLLVVFAAMAIGVLFHLLLKGDKDADGALIYGIGAFKEDVFSMFLTFAAVLLVIFARGDHSAKMGLGSAANYGLAFLLFRSIESQK